MSILVALSTIADGSMYNRHDLADSTIISNRKTFLTRQGIDSADSIRLAVDYQTTDFCRYRIVDQKNAGDGMFGGSAQPCDGLITTTPGLALFLPIADCVGAVLYDPNHHVLMLIHLGRHSLEQQGAQNAVDFLETHFKSQPTSLRVWLSPAAGKESYPIWALDNKGLKEATFEQLHRAGIGPSQITDDPADTTTDERYFSYSEFIKGTRTEDGDHAIVAMLTN